MKIHVTKSTVFRPPWLALGTTESKNEDYELEVSLKGFGNGRMQSEQNLLAALHELRGHVDAGISRLTPK